METRDRLTSLQDRMLFHSQKKRNKITQMNQIT
jgi:nitrogen-specific signal transduction histidine kinase